MKKMYEAPVVHLEQFVVNEYIASACGDENKVYKFTCDAGGGVYGSVYVDSNNNGRLDIIRDEELTSYLPSYHACGKTHEAPTGDEFLNGFYCPNGNIFDSTKVIIWTDGGTNVHCTTNVKMDTWVTDKS